MSDDEKKKRSSTETARRIWLAGIGAYGRAFTEAQGALKEVTGKSSEVFDDLVQKGEMIEKVVEHKGRELLDKTKVSDIEVPALEIDERIKRMRARLSMGVSVGMSGTKGEGQSASVTERLDAIESKIETLSERLDALESSAPKASPKKTKTAKATTRRTKKPSAS